MTSARIHVLVYDDLTAALLDWDDLDAAWASGTMPLVDAALVETVDHTVRTLHRFSTRCAARGSASVSVVGLLQPSSLVSGAIAGGVGERTIATLAGAIDRVRIKQLGDTMDLGEFTTVVIAGGLEQDDSGQCMPTGRNRGRSIASITVPISASTEAIECAVRSDDPLA